MGIGSFLKSAVKAPLNLAKGSIGSTKAALGGDVKGSIGAAKGSLSAGAGPAKDLTMKAGRSLRGGRR